MTYQIKRGVSLFMSPEIEKILEVVCPVYHSFKIPVVITSGVDGPHRENSLHYNFRAIDIRKNFPSPLAAAGWTIHRESILDGMERNFQYKKYPVFIVEEQDHIHLEWCGQ
jgi:hypothetical protein